MVVPDEVALLAPAKEVVAGNIDELVELVIPAGRDDEVVGALEAVEVVVGDTLGVDEGEAEI